MLHLLVDTSTWLDLARRRDGQKWIVPIRVLTVQGKLELLVPSLVLEEFERNRPRIEESMTARVSERFRLLKKDLDEYGGENQQDARSVVDGLAHEVPLIGAMTTRNFDEIAELLRKARRVEPTDRECSRAVQRGLDKQAPFHRSRNSVADALLIELYASAINATDLLLEPHSFITSNSDDFSTPRGDKREPHPDLAHLFAPDEGSSYCLGVDGLDAVLVGHFGDEYEELVEESNFQEEPRSLNEILQAEQECFDRVWYQRSVASMHPLGAQGRARIEQQFGQDLGPYTDFEWGMINGKLSALRWVLGSAWDFLDT